MKTLILFVISRFWLSRLLAIRQYYLFQIIETSGQAPFHLIHSSIEVLLHLIHSLFNEFKVGISFAPKCFRLIYSHPRQDPGHGYSEDHELPDRLAAGIGSRSVNLFDFAFSFAHTVS